MSAAKPSGPRPAPCHALIAASVCGVPSTCWGAAGPAALGAPPVAPSFLLHAPADSPKMPDAGGRDRDQRASPHHRPLCRCWGAPRCTAGVPRKPPPAAGAGEPRKPPPCAAGGGPEGEPRRPRSGSRGPRQPACRAGGGAPRQPPCCGGGAPRPFLYQPLWRPLSWRWTTPGGPPIPMPTHADADTDADVNDRRRRRRHVDARRHDRPADDGARADDGADRHDLAVERGRRDADVDDRPRVHDRRVNIIDRHIARAFAVIDRFVVADVPVRAALELELHLRRRRIPVVVRPAQVAIRRRSEVHVHVRDRMRAVIRVARPFVFERGRIADEVVLPVHLAVQARVGRLVVVNVRDRDVAEAAPDFLRQRVLRYISHNVRS